MSSCHFPSDTGCSPQLAALVRVADTAGLVGVSWGELVSSEAFAQLGAIATFTRRIRIETGVVSVPTRSPVLRATASAKLTSLSENRFALGSVPTARRLPGSSRRRGGERHVRRSGGCDWSGARSPSPLTSGPTELNSLSLR